MKKIAVTVAVLALGLAGCNKTAADNTANDMNVENAAEYDTNAATNDSMNAADNALDTAGNAVENAGNAVDNAASNATN
jgi:predicted small secreted protein